MIKKRRDIQTIEGRKKKEDNLIHLQKEISKEEHLNKMILIGVLNSRMKGNKVKLTIVVVIGEEVTEDLKKGKISQ